MTEFLNEKVQSILLITRVFLFSIIFKSGLPHCNKNTIREKKVKSESIFIEGPLKKTFYFCQHLTAQYTLKRNVM